MRAAGRHLAIFVNPIAGSGRARGLLERFRAAAASAGFPSDLFVSPTRRQLPETIAQATRDGAIIAIAGGDGTIRNALPALLGRPNPVLILPFGTENMLAKQLRIRRRIPALLHTLNSGIEIPFDVAALNGRPYASVAGIGFDAEIVARVDRDRHGHLTHADYALPIWETLRRYHFPPVRAWADGRLICDEPALVFVGNIPRYAIGLRVLRNARWDDGLLDVCVFHCNHATRLLGHTFRTLLNVHLEHSRVRYCQARQVVVEADEALNVQTDGDPAGRLPAEFKILPAAIRLLVPASLRG